MENNKTLFNKIFSFLIFIASNIVMLAFLVIILKNYDFKISYCYYLILIFVFLWSITFLIKLIEIFKKYVVYPKYTDFLMILLIILISTLLSYIGTNYLKLHSVVSASLVSLIFGVFIKKFGAEATIGAFLGMSSFNLIYYDLLIAVLIASTIDFGLKTFYKGHCGKLGFIAFAGGFITFFLFKNPLLFLVKAQNVEIIYILLISVTSAVITNIINNKLKFGPIIAYSLVSLLGALIFNRFEFTKSLGFTTLVFGASFIGMASKEIHHNNIRVVATALVYSFILYLTMNFSNIGGRLGTTTLISLLITQAIDFSFFRNYKVFENIKKVNYTI